MLDRPPSNAGSSDIFARRARHGPFTMRLARTWYSFVHHAICNQLGHRWRQSNYVSYCARCRSRG
jgi:hypothetical protein